MTGLLVAGIGSRDAQGTNYLIADKDTQQSEIEATFERWTSKNSTVKIILLSQSVAKLIRSSIDELKEIIPVVLEIPCDKRYDVEEDPMMQRVMAILGQND